MSPRIRRWERCIMHRGGQTPEFLKEWLSDLARRVLLVGGAGFDPRSTAAAKLLKNCAKCPIHALLIREQRPMPSAQLVQGAEENIGVLRQLLTNFEMRDVSIFSSNDMALTGGRQIAELARSTAWNQYTDVIVDCSALSRGIVFPLVRSILEHPTPPINVHLLVVDQASLDDGIVAEPAERASIMHGFKGRLGLESSQEAAVLWLPQLVPQQQTSLGRIFSSLEPKPHDICPILPFPSDDLRKTDTLITEFRSELESTWEVDPRNIVFASESNPLDLYRSILRIDDERGEVFRHTGGSLVILSPIGSKLLSLGALMAAMERDFPVVYVEAINYKFAPEQGVKYSTEERLVHLWLKGEAYGSSITA